MKLGSYLELKGISHAEFGRRIDVEQPTVSRYVKGERIPEQETMTRIFEQTEGAVTPNDFYDIASPASAA